MDKFKIVDPAYPFKLENSNGETTTFFGATMRDYFAKAAMQAIVTSLYTTGKHNEAWSEKYVGETIGRSIALDAYKIADDMLAIRDKITK